MNTTPNPDASVALSLMGQGYWIVPLSGHRKNPPRFGDRTHGDILADKDKSFMDALVLSQQYSSTGWAAILQATDTTPLAVVDVDAYGITLDAAWAMLSTEPMPPGLGVVKSATSGWHFWMRLPDAATAKKLPGTWDFGQGRKGEIRASREALQLIVLPGSVALNKNGQLARYEQAGHPLDDISGLALMPDTLLSRLTGRADAAPAKGGIPTEAHHFISLLHFISEMPGGGQNLAVAQVGQILGRIGPGEKASPDLISLAWDALRDKLPAADPRHPWTFSGFERTFQSGYKTGAKSRQKHTPDGGGAPTPDDVDAEMISLFGSLPWLIEIVDSKGEFQEFILGHGGPPEERERSSSICSIKNPQLPHLLAELSRLIPAAEQNILTRSPLFLDPAWSKVFKHSLIVRRSIERMGNDPEARFWEIINEWARGAAQGGKFLDTISGRWKALECKEWLIQSADGEALFALHPDAVARLYSRIGDMPATKRLIAAHLHPRALAGTNQRQQTIAVSFLAPEIQAHVRRGYEQWVAAKQKESKDEQADER